MPKASKKQAFYAVKKGHAPGIYHSWQDAEPQVKGYQNAAHKKFTTLKQAETWMNSTMPASSGSSQSHSTAPYARQQSKIVNEVNPWKEGDPRRVYTDGACRNNGQANKNPNAGSGVYWPRSNTESLSERLPGKDQTNQKAELYGICRALETDPTPHVPLDIYTDSSYSISCLEKWHQGWARNKWRNAHDEPVAHSELIRYILALLVSRGREGRVRFVHVKGHSGDPGNEMADSLATAGAELAPLSQERDWELERYEVGMVDG